MKTVAIGNHLVGDGHPVFCVGEIGINANGSLDIASKLIATAALAGCQAVKFQKRTVDVVYTAEELSRSRDSPFGKTNGDLKYALEFDGYDYNEIDRLSRVHHILWFASCWDEASVDFIEQFDPPCYKIASASLTDIDLLQYTRSMGRPIILSTGMSTLAQIDKAVEAIGDTDLVILHCTSTYPCQPQELNLQCIPMLQERYNVPIGFSDHSPGLPASIAAVGLGACMIERHITLNRTMFGSDQAASIEPRGLSRLVDYIRYIEQARGDGIKTVYPSEELIREKLRRKDTTGAS